MGGAVRPAGRGLAARGGPFAAAARGRCRDFTSRGTLGPRGHHAPADPAHRAPRPRCCGAADRRPLGGPSPGDADRPRRGGQDPAGDRGGPRRGARRPRRRRLRRPGAAARSRPCPAGDRPGAGGAGGAGLAPGAGARCRDQRTTAPAGARQAGAGGRGGDGDRRPAHLLPAAGRARHKSRAPWGAGRVRAAGRAVADP